MKFRILWLCLIAVFPATVSRADILWYNGDYDNRDALTNQGKVPINMGGTPFFETVLVYENVIVPTNQVWTVTGVFSTDQVAYYQSPTNATWSIRSGVSAGNGGTVIVAGDSATTLTTLNENPNYTYVGTETKVSVAIAPVMLTAGTYWVAVAPDSRGYYGDQSYVETTSGQNAIGIPPGNDGNSYATNNLPSNSGYENFTPTSTIEGPGTWDYSLGVIGTFTTVPEPSSLALTALGGAGLALLSRRRARRAA